jgi:hypothetical protein
MRRFSLFAPAAALSALICLTAPLAAGAQQRARPLASAGAEQREDFDWLRHTRQTLDELHAKLNLGSEQASAWNDWSEGVLRDAHQQLAQKTTLREAEADAAKSPAMRTTPELMARGIAQLRAQSTWLQEHLVELEAAQLRTKTFYGALDTNQRTIFDLFWHEMHHRTSGHDEAQGLPDGDGPGAMMERMDRPAGAY